MRTILPFTLLLAACSQQAADPSLPTGTFAGEGRDRLCIAGEAGAYRAGLIVYGQGDNNCSASGRVEMVAGQLSLVPRGEATCQIPLILEGDTVRVGEVPAACSYYCGPGATMGGKAFQKSDNATAATDLAGDPLC